MKTDDLVAVLSTNVEPVRRGLVGRTISIAVASVDYIKRPEVLPSVQERKELSRAHRLDFAPQPSNRQTVNAREQAAVAPLELTLAAREVASQNLPLGFQLRQRLIHQITRHRQLAGEFGRPQRPRALEPASSPAGRAGHRD